MAQPIFYVNGVPQSNANPGDTLYLDIPGYRQIWLTQYQNGVLQYDGLYTLPAPPYVLANRDVGTYQGIAYEVVNGQKGQQIASWSFVVGNASATQGTPPSTGAAATPQAPSNTVACLSGLCGPSASPPTSVVTTGAPGPTGTGVIATGGPGQYVQQPVSGPTGAGINPFGDLPGVPPPTATAGGLPGSQPTTTTTTAATFNLSGFLKNPLFLLFVALVVLVYFLTEKKGG
jgi:hypothetical protein